MKTEKISVSLENGLFQRMEETRRSVNRSAFIASAVENYVDGLKFQQLLRFNLLEKSTANGMQCIGNNGTYNERGNQNVNRNN